ncbi:DUF732 domain-containing protein [Mycobacterium sp. pUA109]|uniref:DUF732 domain-containing protein n=1 Tax=Mycobacterium sp. pUA109 TaxID=3238982 RepID=UPI00351B0CCE
MADFTVRPGVSRAAGALIIVAGGLFGFGAITAPQSRADTVAYLVNVTMRPGYNFANADAALSYGHGICEKVGGSRSYPELVNDVETDFSTTDEYQASYLISQAVNELCPALIWQLRRSAATYRPAVR